MIAKQVSFFEEEELKELESHLEILHKDSEGWITLATKNGRVYKQRHYKYKDLILYIERNNCYISQNTFYKTYRRVETLKELKALYIDIDCYNTGLNKESVMYELEKDYFNQSVPAPNLVIDSGRGLYLVWRIEAVPHMALPLWRAVENYLYNKLKSFGADAKAIDPTRILRIASTVNTKSNTAVKVLEKNEYTYTLREIQQSFLPELPEKLKKTKGRPKKIVSLFNEYSLYYARILDITTVCELRQWDISGKREIILFLYRYWNCCYIGDIEDALNMALEFNQQFTEPLSDNEVIKATRSAEKCYLSKNKEYKYKNSTLIELLDITEEEEKHLKTIISKSEANRREKEAKKKARRNENGLTKREQDKQDKIYRVKQLKEKGLSVRKISKELDISVGAVSEIINGKY